MATIITIPDFTYSAHFYAEILEDLTLYLRNNCLELTDEDPTEPHMQIIRAMSLGYHLNSVLTDLVANEMFLPTAKLRTSHKGLLALIDYKLAQASPASADVLAQLSQIFTSAKTIAIKGNQFATVETRGAQSVEFELLADVSTTLRTDQVGYVYAFDKDASAYTDHTAEAQSAGGLFTPGAWDPEAGDMLYIGHPGVMFDRVDVTIGTPAVGLTGVWEYYDGSFDQGVPTSVTNLGSTLEFNVNSILGSASRVGTTVRVRSAQTGAFQDLVVTFSGGVNKITTTGATAFLGQAAPSTNVNDYIVGCDWRELTGVTDSVANLTATGQLTFTLPQTLTQNWRKTLVFIQTAYWLRYRIISVSAPSNPAITQIRIDQGKQYVVFAVTQGKSRSEDPLGSSDGSASQQFSLANFPVIDDANIVITVNESGVDFVYTRVDNFLNSVSTDRHYTVEFDDDGGGIITFGTGTNGKIPPTGTNNIKASYRTMDEIDGNVGQNTISVNRSGVAYIATLLNPRPASGFSLREGSDDADLARLKIAGPASLRTGDRAVSPGDVETVAQRFKAADGSVPVKRALAIEEAFGVKTIECVVVGAGGVGVNASKLIEIADYFNGTLAATLPGGGTGTETKQGVLLMNQQLTATNFTQKAINVNVTLTGGSAIAVATALTALLNPLATKPDGTWRHQFGGDVTLLSLYEAIAATSPPPTKAIITSPAGDTALAQRELPVKGTITINGVVY